MPVTIAKRLESLRSRFFWGGSEKGRRLAWVKWDQVMAKRDAGGLGIGSLVSFNMGLVLKWQWRFFNTPDAPWVRLLKIYYGRNGGFFAKNRPPGGGSPWSRILAATYKLHKMEVVPPSTLRRKLGNGETTCFWEDCWIGENPLSLRFPRLFALETDRRCSVADRWDGAELQALGELVDNVVCSQSQDSWLLLDQLPTRARLSGRGFEIESIMCPVCGRAPEHLVHLFCGCEVARNIWDGVFRSLGLAPFGDLHPKEVFRQMETCRLTLNQKKALEVVMCAVWWLIWRYRNDVVHDNRKMRKG
ncbi:hypothetical protein LXL04_008150 [Taraxacum kok-saghyz]